MQACSAHAPGAPAKPPHSVEPPTGGAPLIPYRLLFPLTALFALAAVPLWLVIRHANPAVTGTEWHGHEMLFGYAFAVIAGFLSTRPARNVEWIMAGTWLAARIAAARKWSAGVSCRNCFSGNGVYRNGTALVRRHQAPGKPYPARDTRRPDCRRCNMMGRQGMVWSAAADPCTAGRNRPVCITATTHWRACVARGSRRPS